MATKTRVARTASKFDDKNVVVYTTETFDQEANIALVLIEKWGLVAAMPDGEDSAGRAKLRLPTPQELATRALDIAQEFTALARKRGHVVLLPDLNEINKEQDDKAAAREQASKD